MDRLKVEEKLALHGFSYKTLASGVRVSALVPGDASREGEEDPEVLVRATRDGDPLQSDRYSSHEEAAARYVELVEKYRET